MIVTKAQKRAFLWLWVVMDCIELPEGLNFVRYLGDLENGPLLTVSRQSQEPFQYLDLCAIFCALGWKI